MLDMSYEAFRANDAKLGKFILQEIEGMIWPRFARPAKYAVEAERRAFGEVVRFAGISVSAYPYEGTESDLGKGQRTLFEYAKARCAEYWTREDDSSFFAWVLDAGGRTRTVKQRSRSKTVVELGRLATGGQVTASAAADLVIRGRSGLVSITLEEENKPRIRAVALVTKGRCQPFRFHLDDPLVFKKVSNGA